MGAKPLLLCLGHDAALNRTRRLVLQRVFTVKVADNLQEAISLLTSERFDLVLLCYSLSERDTRAMIDLIHGVSRQTKVLVLANGREGLRLMPPDEEFLLSGPAELLQKAASMAGIRLAADDSRLRSAGRQAEHSSGG